MSPAKGPKGPTVGIWRQAAGAWIVGGVGIIVMAMIILPFLKVGGMQLFRTESSDRSEKIVPRAFADLCGRQSGADRLHQRARAGVCAVQHHRKLRLSRLDRLGPEAHGGAGG